MFMTNDLIITCAVIGAEITKENYPYFPATTDELAESAKAAVNAGASIIHLHVRDKDGRPSQDVKIFEEVTKKIKDRCECIIQYSTGGAAGTPVDERCAPLSLRPEMATLSMGTLNFGPDIFENSEQTICTISQELQKNNIMPELEIFDYGMMEEVKRYLKRKLIPEKFHVDFVLGVPGGMSGHLRNLVFLTEQLEKNQTWTVAGIGRYELPLSTHAIAMGGHVRVGLEDNIYYRKGEFAKSNAQLVERIVRIATEFDRPIATPSKAREILGL
jgi:3-keto-5-aminohexanoate cleavage enzyme